jgi:hypothetical protein
MELVQQEQTTKFYQRISFWILFFILLLVSSYLVFSCFFGFDNTLTTIGFFVIMYPLGIIEAFGAYVFYGSFSYKVFEEINYYFFGILSWVVVWLIIIFLRKKNFFNIIAILLAGWCILSVLGLGFSLWWIENWHNRVDFGA